MKPALFLLDQLRNIASLGPATQNTENNDSCDLHMDLDGYVVQKSTTKKTSKTYLKQTYILLCCIYTIARCNLACCSCCCCCSSVLLKLLFRNCDSYWDLPPCSCVWEQCGLFIQIQQTFCHQPLAHCSLPAFIAIVIAGDSRGNNLGEVCIQFCSLCFYEYWKLLALREAMLLG